MLKIIFCLGVFCLLAVLVIMAVCSHEAEMPQADNSDFFISGEVEYEGVPTMLPSLQGVLSPSGSSDANTNIIITDTTYEVFTVTASPASGMISFDGKETPNTMSRGLYGETCAYEDGQYYVVPTCSWWSDDGDTLTVGSCPIEEGYPVQAETFQECLDVAWGRGTPTPTITATSVLTVFVPTPTPMPTSTPDFTISSVMHSGIKDGNCYVRIPACIEYMRGWAYTTACPVEYGVQVSCDDWETVLPTSTPIATPTPTPLNLFDQIQQEGCYSRGNFIICPATLTPTSTPTPTPTSTPTSTPTLLWQIKDECRIDNDTGIFWCQVDVEAAIEEYVPMTMPTPTSIAIPITVSAMPITSTIPNKTKRRKEMPKEQPSTPRTMSFQSDAEFVERLIQLADLNELEAKTIGAVLDAALSFISPEFSAVIEFFYEERKCWHIPELDAKANGEPFETWRCQERPDSETIQKIWEFRFEKNEELGSQATLSLRY